MQVKFSILTSIMTTSLNTGTCFFDRVFLSNKKRHVILPKELSVKVPRDRFLSEYEWRALGIQMSRGWQHYGHHQPEPHILLFKRVFPGVTPRSQQEQQLQKIAVQGPSFVQNQQTFGFQ